MNPGWFLPPALWFDFWHRSLSLLLVLQALVDASRGRTTSLFLWVTGWHLRHVNYSIMPTCPNNIVYFRIHYTMLQRIFFSRQLSQSGSCSMRHPSVWIHAKLRMTSSRCTTRSTFNTGWTRLMPQVRCSWRRWSKPVAMRRRRKSVMIYLAVYWMPTKANKMEGAYWLIGNCLVCGRSLSLHELSTHGLMI